MAVNDESIMIRKEVGIAYFTVPCQRVWSDWENRGSPQVRVGY